MITTITLNPAIDCIIKVKKLKPGTLNRAVEEAVFPGGKGVNVSLVLSELGIDTCCCGFLAGATGKAYEAMLEERGLKQQFQFVTNGFTRINTKISAMEETEINGAGPVPGWEDVDRLCQVIQSLADGDFLVLSGNVPSSIKGAYEYILKNMPEGKVKPVVDVTGEELKKTLPYHPFLIKPNLEELEDLFSVRIKTEEEVKHYAGELQSAGARNVLVSMGALGMLLLTEDARAFFAEGVKGEAANTVGAGDSAVAGFLAGWEQSHDWEKALRLAAAAGTATAFTYGTAGGAAIRRLEGQIQIRMLEALD